MPPEPVLHFEWPARIEGGIVDLETVLNIIGMHAVRPALSEFLLQGAPRELEPALVHERTELVGAGDPQQCGCAVGHGAEALFAFLQRAFAPHEIELEAKRLD